MGGGLNRLRVAVVHDWLTSYAGSERVLEQVLRIVPQADVFCLVDFLPAEQRGFLGARRVRTSFLQKMPFCRRHYRTYLPLMPLAVEQFDLSGYDLVISSSHAVAKGALTGADQPHVCLCHSPMRYAWDLYHESLGAAGLARGPRGLLARLTMHYLRLWDARTANGVDVFVAVSNFIARRIWKVYRRRSTVIYPPVDVAAFTPGGPKDDYYLAVSRFVPYKRMDLVAEAFRRLPDRRLVAVGDGPQLAAIRRRAPRNVRLVGRQGQAELIRYMQQARALVFAATEDFGIVPVEAQACGTPVIAYGRGGAAETVIDGQTGLLFDEKTPAALADAVRRFEAQADRFDPARARANAERFGPERFRRDLAALLERTSCGGGVSEPDRIRRG
jgi:glycosyltransferase involved in cell wall biosynthesis